MSVPVTSIYCICVFGRLDEVGLQIYACSIKIANCSGLSTSTLDTIFEERILSSLHKIEVIRC